MADLNGFIHWLSLSVQLCLNRWPYFKLLRWVLGHSFQGLWLSSMHQNSGKVSPIIQDTPRTLKYFSRQPYTILNPSNRGRRRHCTIIVVVINKRECASIGKLPNKENSVPWICATWRYWHSIHWWERERTGKEASGYNRKKVGGTWDHTRRPTQ